jgi:hypothetical protein
VGGKALYPDGTIQHAGGYVDERGWGSHYGYRCKDIGQFDQTRDVDYVTGAALLVTRQALETLGGLDERFEPAYFEDVDWCCRARKADFRVVYVPKAVLTHRETSVAADGSHQGQFLIQRNRLRLVLKHWPLERLSKEFVQAERTWLESAAQGDEQMVTATHHAYLYHLLHLSDVVAGRKELMEVSGNEADVLADVLLTLRVVVPLGPVRLGVEPEVVQAQEGRGLSAELSATTPLDTDAEKQGGSSGAGSRGDDDGSGPEGAPPLSQDEILDILDETWHIREQQLSSDAPVFGPLLAALRRSWNRVSTEQYVRPMIEQQSEFNAYVVKLLSHLAGRTEASENLLSYFGTIHGHVDSIRELKDQLNELNSQLRKLRDDRHRPGEVLAEYIRENGREIAELAQEIGRLRESVGRSGE